MSSYAAVRDRPDHEAGRISNWATDYLDLDKVTVVDLGCAAGGVLAAAQLRFGRGVTRTYLAVSLALPLLWVAALWMAGAYDVRFMGSGSDEFRKVLSGGVGLTAGAALIMLARVMAVVAVTSRLHGRGPALFTQLRAGKDGHSFRIYKFRTMVVDAEQRRAPSLASNDFDGVLFKLRKDPRVTAMGAHLRRWAIDELPQLLNVFLGHMSLIGPRPALPGEAEKQRQACPPRTDGQAMHYRPMASQRMIGSVLGGIGAA